MSVKPSLVASNNVVEKLLWTAKTRRPYRQEGRQRGFNFCSGGRVS